MRTGDRFYSKPQQFRGDLGHESWPSDYLEVGAEQLQATRECPLTRMVLQGHSCIALQRASLDRLFSFWKLGLHLSVLCFPLKQDRAGTVGVL